MAKHTFVFEVSRAYTCTGRVAIEMEIAGHPHEGHVEQARRKALEQINDTSLSMDSIVEGSDDAVFVSKQED